MNDPIISAYRSDRIDIDIYNPIINRLNIYIPIMCLKLFIIRLWIRKSIHNLIMYQYNVYYPILDSYKQS